MALFTVQQFTESLENRAFDLRNALGGGSLRFRDDRRKPCICRLTEHLEASVTCGGQPWLLALPLTEAAAERSVRTTHRLRQLGPFHTAERRLLNGVFCRVGADGREVRTDVVAERLPEGRPLSEVLMEGCRAGELLRELEAMESEFSELDMAHNNLKSENIYLTPQGRMVAVRCHRMTFDGAGDADRKAFAALRRLVASNDATEVLEAMSTESSAAAGSSYRRLGPVSEGLMRIETECGVGFADPSGDTVIAPQFVEAEDFREGRAAVMTEKGCGVIDKEGRRIVAPEHEWIVYDEMEGVIYGRRGGLWRLYDYEGHPLTPLGHPFDPDPKQGLRREPVRRAVRQSAEKERTNK